MYRKPILLLLFLFVWPVAAGAQDTYLPTVADNVVNGDEPELTGKIIITIDDCAFQSLAEEEFNILNSRGLKATFFCNTKYLIQQDPAFWRGVLAAGFEFGYHTQNHNGNMSRSQLEADFAGYLDFMRVYLEDPNLQVRFVRPPFGAWDSAWLAWAAANDLYTVRWNIVEPRVSATQEYIRIVVPHPEGGPIFLLHVRRPDANWLANNINFLMTLVGQADANTFPTLSGAFLSGVTYSSW